MLEGITTGAAPPEDAPVQRLTEDAPVLRLTEGGPGVGLLRRLKLASPRWRAPHIAVLLAAVTWLPLLVLSASQGLLLEPAEGSFIRDLATHARLLVALPVLVLAALPIGASLGAAAAQFTEAGLVRPDERRRFAGLLLAARRLRDSRTAEILVLLAVCLTTYVLLTASSLREGSRWLMPDPGAERTPAGHWYAFVSLPIFHLVWLRWLYLVGVWARFLFRVSRLHLRLNPAHPDGAGGLGFLGVCSVPLGALLFAASSVHMSEGLRRVLFTGADQQIVWVGALILLVVALAMFIGPLLAFTPALLKLKHHGALEYGALASKYTRLFDEKWLDGEGPHEGLLGNPDIQSLADLASTHDRTQKMSALPIGRRDVVAMALLGLAPLVLFAAATVPIPDVMTSLLRIFG